MQNNRNYKVLLDVPSADPVLGFEEMAEVFSSIAEQSEPRFAIGIFGGWGSGKTTLLEAIERKLDSDFVLPVRFSAWRYEKEQHLIVPLLDTIRDALTAWADTHKDASKSAKKAASRVGRVAYAILAGMSLKVGIPGAITASFDANKALSHVGRRKADALVPRSFYYAAFKELKSAFTEFFAEDERRRFVVFVDDLDRCLPRGALEVLESMKLFFDFEGFVFIVGLDRNLVEWFIETRYAEESSDSTQADHSTSARLERKVTPVSGEEYIKKLFQLPYSLSPVSIAQVGEFLESLLEHARLSPDQASEIRQVVSPHIGYLVTDAGVNPREIKRFINAFTLTARVKPGLDRDVVLALQTIAFRNDREWDPVRDLLYTYEGYFTKALAEDIGAGGGSAVQSLDPSMGPIPDSFLAYVQAGQPGEPLLGVESLSEYIYSGQASFTLPSPEFIEMLRSVVALRTPVREVLGKIEAGGEQGLALEALNRLSQQLDQVTRGLFKLSDDPVLRNATEDVGSLRGLIERLVTEGAVADRDWNKIRATVDRPIARLQKNLLAYQRQTISLREPLGRSYGVLPPYGPGHLYILEPPLNGGL